MRGFTRATRPSAFGETRLADTRRVSTFALASLRSLLLRRTWSNSPSLEPQTLFLGFQPSRGRSDHCRCACTHYLVFKEPNPHARAYSALQASAPTDRALPSVLGEPFEVTIHCPFCQADARPVTVWTEPGRINPLALAVPFWRLVGRHLSLGLVRRTLRSYDAVNALSTRRHALGVTRTRKLSFFPLRITKY